MQFLYKRTLLFQYFVLKIERPYRYYYNILSSYAFTTVNNVIMREVN